MTHAALLASTFAATLEQLPGAGPVLLIQDTTSLDFSQHPATQGLGVLENKNMCGFLAHTTLAVSMAPDREGLPLGLVAQAIWARPVAETGTRNKRHTTPFAEKESNKWVTGVAAGSLPAGGEYITVCDREAHIYEFMDRVLHNKLDFIVRATDARSRCCRRQTQPVRPVSVLHSLRLWPTSRCASVPPSSCSAALTGLHAQPTSKCALPRSRSSVRAGRKRPHPR